MARAAGGMFDFSQIQIPANLLAGALLFKNCKRALNRVKGSKINTNSCYPGGSGGAGSSSAAPARARVSEEDPAAIR